MSLVINEWIFHDIDGSNQQPAQERAEDFLESLIRGQDQIVVLAGTRWTEKAWQLWKSNDTKVQILSKLLYFGVLLDPRKCTYLSADEVEDLPPELAKQVPADDGYLFQTALAGQANTIVTTDMRLIDTVKKAVQYGIELVDRDDFYSRYGI